MTVFGLFTNIVWFISSEKRSKKDEGPIFQFRRNKAIIINNL